MPGSFRATMFFSRGAYGWSETHWATAGLSDLTQVLNAAVALAPYRASLLDDDSTLDFVRVTDDTVFRDSLFAQLNLKNGNAPYSKVSIGSQDAPNSPVDVALLIRGEGTASYRKSIFLGGVPDPVISYFDQTANPLPAPTAYVGRWLTALGTQPGKTQASGGYLGQLLASWAFLIRKRAAVGVAYKRATAYPTVVGTVVTALNIIEPGSGYAPPAIDELPYYVVIRGGNGKGATANFVLGAGGTAALALTNGGFGYLTLPQVFISAPGYTLQPYSNFIVRGVTHRKRGRPFGVRRGRRRSSPATGYPR